MNTCVFENENECNALTEKQCNGCPFRKTEEEFRAGRRKAAIRIYRLPDPIRKRIIRKYYGTMKAFRECLE